MGRIAMPLHMQARQIALGAGNATDLICPAPSLACRGLRIEGTKSSSRTEAGILPLRGLHSRLRRRRGSGGNGRDTRSYSVADATTAASMEHLFARVFSRRSDYVRSVRNASKWSGKTEWQEAVSWECRPAAHRFQAR